VDAPLASIDGALAAFDLPYSLLGHSWTESMHNRLDYDSWAAFGDVIWHLSDRLNLTTGLRYTRDHKRFSWYNAPRRADELDSVLQALNDFGITGLLPEDAQAILGALSSNLIYTDAIGTRVAKNNTWSKFSPRVVLDYALTPDSMVYGSFSKGYKAGGYDSVEVGSLFQPEDVTNYEIGYKANLPRYHLQFSASAYYYRYDNIQSLTLDSSTESIVPLYLTRVSDQEAKGLDVDLQWRASTALKFNLSGAYIDSTYRKATTDEGLDLSGQPTGEPTFSFAAGMSYTWQNVFGGGLEFDLSQAYRGKSRCNLESVEQGECDVSPNFSIGAAQQRTDARLDWSSPTGAWAVALYVNNAFDKRYVTGVDNITLSTLGTPYARISPPRFWGVEFRANF
jgi:iron complex outermembrane receptor protein